ncbi:MAG: DUF3376 domain-containing protein, partial [Micromonosporaceae bacterium]|nr:DUF3376 domain-containing protein [Micromonosporaceae bacterium]
LDILGYDKVTVDVISGSSAGGLNGVLLALNLAYGMPFGARVRNLWLELGDLEQLSREPREKAPVSLLYGDDDGGRGFYGRLRNATRTLLKEAPAGHQPERNIRLVLTATRLHPRGVRVHETLGAPLHASQAKAHFLFQHRAVNGGSPIPGDFAPDSTEQVSDLLAYAARTTSSFPAAFPPAMIRVDQGDAPFQDRDFQGVCSETGAGDHNGAAVELIDGGVLDNIPVAWAIRGIASAPSERPVDRWLVYLQPVEPQTRDGSETPPTQRRVTRLVRLLLQSASRRMDSESLLDDAEEMRAAEATVRHLRGVAAAGIPSDPESVLGNRERYAAYRELVGMAEGARLAQLLQEPGSVLGPDPLPLPTDRPLKEMDPQVAAEVVRGLGDAAITCPLALPERMPPVPVGIRTPFGLARTVALLLDWVRAAETYDQLSRRSSQELRDQLFSARLAAELLVAARDRMILRRLRHARDAADVVDIARRAAWRLNEAVPPGWKVPTAGTWRDWADRLRDLAEQPLPDQAPEGWPETVFAPFWEELAAIGVSVGKALDRNRPGPPGFDMLRAGALAETSEGLESDGATTMSRALASAELLLGPVRPDPFTEPTDMKFHAITTSRQNPAEGRVFGGPLEPHERADRKLSGNQLINFAAFLSARWRHTDWTWGRLDTVPSLVELMHADSGRVAERLEKFTDDELWERLKRLYVADAAASVSAAAGTSQDASADRLATRWAELGVTADDARRRFVEVVTDRLQQEVLAEELPVLVKLSDRGGDRDLPPSEDDLTELPPVDVAADAGRIADVGDETLRVLLRRWHVRRTAVRIGMVGWRAVQPAGDGIFARLARAAFGVIKPVALMPALAAVASPIGGITAGLGSWLLVAAVAGTWSNPVIQPVLAVGFALAFGIAAWRLWGASGWTAAASAAAGALFAVLGGWLLVALGLNQLWDSSALRYGAIVLGALAAIVPFVWLLASRGRGTRLLGWMLLLLLAAGALGVALSTVPDLVSRLSGGRPAEEIPLNGAVGWLSGPTLGLLTLYAVLSIPAWLLTYFFPAAPRR